MLSRKKPRSPIVTPLSGGNRARTMSYARSSPNKASLLSLLGVIVIVLVQLVPTHHGTSDLPALASSQTARETLEKNNNAQAEDIITIAYAISLIKCGDGKQNAADGLTEAALVLRHSVHHISVRNPQSGSKYDYKMYALVHRQAESCSQPLADAGYTIRVVDPPVTTPEIKGDYLRKTIHKEVCCGVDEFVKLHSYALPEPISVHVDIDFIFLKPMDLLFDVILENDKGGAARKALLDSNLVEGYNNRPVPSSPQQPIDTFFVRDWFSTYPGRNSPYQAGFIVARRDPSIVKKAADIVREGNYTEGFGRDNGWGGLGYGGFVGARAMQGLMAYYYDVVSPGTHLELDNCLFNHIGTHLMGERKRCKTGRDDLPCPDCTKTPLSDLYSIHYTACRKPWNCVAEAIPGGRTKGASYGNALDTRVADPTHCLKATQIWHAHRADLERRIQQQRDSYQKNEAGPYQREYFLGHCTEEKQYARMDLIKETEVYDGVYRSYSEAPLFYIPKKS